jgi:rubrerythrin
MDRLAQKHKDKVIDLLAERLCFERASVKLYEKVLERVSRSASGKRSSGGDYSTYGLSGYREGASRGMHEDIRGEMGRAGHESELKAHEREVRVLGEMLPRLHAVRDQEKGHEQWLEGCIRSLGGDPKRRTELARLTSREMAGIESVIKKDPELPHLFHALLAAEHVDTAGWDLLMELADTAGDLEAKAEFERRLREEEQHIAFLREALRSFSAHEVLEQDLQSPTQEIPPSTH